jgi:hypothetical protein
MEGWGGVGGGGTYQLTFASEKREQIGKTAMRSEMPIFGLLLPGHDGRYIRSSKNNYSAVL